MIDRSASRLVQRPGAGRSESSGSGSNRLGSLSSANSCNALRGLANTLNAAARRAPLPRWSPRTGNRPFRFQLPDAPYSFSGKLISLIWAIEAVAEGIKEAARYEFVLAPEGREIELGSTTKHLSPQEAALQQKAVDLATKLAAKQKG